MAISIPNKQEILVLDYDTRTLYKKNPKDTEPLTQGYEIILKDDSEFGDYLVKRKSNQIPIKKLPENENLYLVHSELRNNLFFPLKDFQELYREEFKGIMIDISKRIGAKRYKFEFFEKEIDMETRRDKKNGNINGNYEDIEAEIGILKEKEEGKKAKQKKGIYSESDLSPNPIPKEELQKFIDEEEINLNALPTEFLRVVKEYLKYERVTEKNPKRKDTRSISLEKTAKSLVKISSSVGVEDFLRVGVETNFIGEEEKSYRFCSRISWELEF